MNIIFAFPVPFLFEPLNGTVNFFKDLFDGLMEAYFKAYFWIKERIFGISKPNIPEIPRRKDKTESWEYRKPKYDPEVLYLIYYFDFNKIKDVRGKKKNQLVLHLIIPILIVIVIILKKLIEIIALMQNQLDPLFKKI